MEEIKTMVKEIIAEMKKVRVSCVIKKSDEINEIATALSKFQGEVLNPDKSANNPFFKSKYAPLDSLLNEARPKLAKYGLAILQSSSCTDDKATVTTLVTHSSGQWIEAEPLTLKAAKADAQGIGSAITYARRYTLSAILGVVGEEDDDGNSATGKTNNDSDSKGKTKPQSDSDIKLKEKQNNILTLMSTKIESGIDKELIYKVIADNNDGRKNPNSIKTIKVCEKIINEIENLK